MSSHQFEAVVAAVGGAVTSNRKLQANRLNSRSSTGPKTAGGKATSSGNARRHGLRVPVRSDPVLSAEVDALTREIVGSSADLELIGLARRVAEAQVDVFRVRRARHNVIAEAMADPFPPALPKAAPASFRYDREGLAETLSDLSQRLLVFDRYECRAISRRNSAIREFNDARSAAVAGKAG
jgi:hypothetical protein